MGRERGTRVGRRRRSAPAIRLVHLADIIEAFHHAGGTEAALHVARERRGTQFDPELVDCFCARHTEILENLGGIAAWEEVITLDPGLGAGLSEDHLERALTAFGDFSDLKSPLRIGDSRGVAELAAQAGAKLGLPEADVVTLRRAAMVKDVGMIGIPSAVWDEPGEWSLAQRERARTHPYLTERMLARVPQLAEVGRCASLHHERLDGSGYPHGCAARPSHCRCGSSVPPTSTRPCASPVRTVRRSVQPKPSG